MRPTSYLDAHCETGRLGANIPAATIHIPAGKLLRLPEVAERLDISEPSVRRLIENGDLESTDVGSGPGRRPRLRVRPAALEAFIASRTTTRPRRVRS